MIPKAVIRRILKNNDAKRISEDAVTSLNDTIVDFANKICAKSVQLANHAGRMTVYASDIKLAK